MSPQSRPIFIVNEFSIGLDSHLFVDGGNGDRQLIFASRWLLDYLLSRVDAIQQRQDVNQGLQHVGAPVFL
jgi:hypothetical protein